MQKICQKKNTHIARYRYTGKQQQGKSSTRIINAAYHSIDDFLRTNPIATMNRYGDRVISGSRIC
jgi:hypothetical protein